MVKHVNSVRTVNERVNVPKHISSFQIECSIQAPKFREDKGLLFEPLMNPQWPEGLEFCDTLVSVNAKTAPKLVLSVQNPTNHDVTLPGQTGIGDGQSVKSAHPADLFNTTR